MAHSCECLQRLLWALVENWRNRGRRWWMLSAASDTTSVLQDFPRVLMRRALR